MKPEEHLRVLGSLDAEACSVLLAVVCKMCLLPLLSCALAEEGTGPSSPFLCRSSWIGACQMRDAGSFLWDKVPTFCVSFKTLHLLAAVK